MKKYLKLPNLNIFPEISKIWRKTYGQLLSLYYISRAFCGIAKTLHSFKKYVSYRLISKTFVHRLINLKSSRNWSYIFLERILITDRCLNKYVKTTLVGVAALSVLTLHNFCRLKDKLKHLDLTK